MLAVAVSGFGWLEGTGDNDGWPVSVDVRMAASFWSAQFFYPTHNSCRAGLSLTNLFAHSTAFAQNNFAQTFIVLLYKRKNVLGYKVVGIFQVELNSMIISGSPD